MRRRTRLHSLAVFRQRSFRRLTRHFMHYNMEQAAAWLQLVATAAVPLNRA
jgi:hypothetical protein